ncbi:MAG: transglutaminase-like domain-containing protein, partial [Acidobacteriota bacterium]
AAVFDFTVASGGQEVGVSGRFADGLLRAELASGDGAPTEVEIPIDDPLAFASGSLGNLVALPTCEPGERYRLDAFDPLTLQASEARVTCGERETITVAGVDREAQQVRLETGGVETEAWLDEAGMMLRARTPFGLVLEALDMDPTLASDESTAIDGSTAGDGRAAAGLLARTAVKPSGERPFRGASRIVLSASGVERPLPVDDHQRVTANGFTLVHGVPGGGCAPRPEHLAAEPFVESDHPRIQEQARQIVGDATERSEQARLLYEWVWGTLEKTPVLGLPSAIEVLDDGRGDCNEHTVLYTALARAVELPTRIAVGLVWSDDLDGFYYHAWPEVCVEAGWQRMDPTLGQEIADATHIKILEGGIARWPQLVPYIGRLAIEIDAIE